MNSIYVLCPDDNRPVGGIKVLYRHVDTLNAHGYRAAIVHKKKGFRCTWFENDTRVEYYARLEPDAFDFVVVPEVNGPKALDLFPEAQKIIFNQNAYYTFLGYPLLDTVDKTTAYRHPRLLAALVVSEDNREYLSYAFPKLRVERIHKGVDAGMFRFRELKDKRPHISFMARRHPEDVRQVINILKFRGMLDGMTVERVDGKNEREVAEILAQSLIFMSFGYPKGLPAAPLEAMLAGCLVIGYHGMGGREYYKPEYTWPVSIGDTVGVARAVEEALRACRSNPAAMQAKALAAREFVAREYSLEREARDVRAFWDKLMIEQGRDAIAQE
jgi:glycosyltransferase involved in cell wall biosynthesis